MSVAHWSPWIAARPASGIAVSRAKSGHRLARMIPPGGALLFGVFAAKQGAVIVVTTVRCDGLQSRHDGLRAEPVWLENFGAEEMLLLQRGGQDSGELGGWLRSIQLPPLGATQLDPGNRSSRRSALLIHLATGHRKAHAVRSASAAPNWSGSLKGVRVYFQCTRLGVKKTASANG